MNESTNNRFLSQYNALDFYLKRITGNQTENMIAYYERILPQRLSAEMRTVREYKNKLESHPVLPENKKPIIPMEWVKWLERQYNYCLKNSQKVKFKLLNEMKKDQEKKERIFNEKVEKVIKSREVKLSNHAEIIRIQLRKDQNFPAKKYSDLENAYEKKLLAEKAETLKLYKKKYNIKVLSRQVVVTLIAKEVVARLSDSELDYLQGKR